MKITLEQNKLSKALNIVSRVTAGAKTTLPILNNVLIRVEKEAISFISTNLDMAVIVSLIKKADEEGTITVPARLLAEFVGNLPRNDEITISSDKLKIKTVSGKYSSVINGVSADDFPELPEIDEEKAIKFIVGIDEFKAGINQVIIATSNDMTRPALTGVYFNTFEQDLYIAATDGYRLADKKLISNVKSEIHAIVPTASLQEVMRSISDSVDSVEIIFDENQVKFKIGEIAIISKLIDASFPDYRQLIPKDNDVILNLNKDEVLRVTKLAALFAKEVGGSIICETNSENNIFSVSSVANEFGENKSEISVNVNLDGKVVLNSRFLISALNALDEKEIEFSFSSKNGVPVPVILKNKISDNYTYIIMPLKS